jgi:hypothetical protein
MKRNIAILIVMIFMSAFAASAIADSSSDAPVTPATDIHGLPANNPGFGGASANPDGEGQGGGDGIHDIADVQGGAAGTPADGNQPPACVAHGGLDTVNNNCE